MIATDDLFRLIKSLTQSEKRYFRLFSSLQKGNKNYLKLFDAISIQKEYNEEEVKKSLKGENLVEHFAREKNSLYRLIMKNLRIYHAEISIETRIMELIRDAEIQFHKSLYDQQEKTLTKARKLINKYEKFLMTPLITSQEWKVMDLKLLPKSIKEEKETYEKLMNINSYMDLYSRLLNLSVTIHQLRNRKDLSALDEIMKDKLLRKESNALSYNAKVVFYNIYGLYFELKANPDAAYDYRKRLNELLEAHPEQMEIRPDRYPKALYNFCVTQIVLKKFTEAEASIKKIKNILYGVSSSEDIRVLKFHLSSTLETHFYIQKGAFETGISILKKIESGMIEFSGMIERAHELILFFNFGCLYFGAGEFRKAGKWFNKILNETGTVRQDLQSLANILLLMIDYETSGIFSEHILKSAYHFLNQNSRLFRFETTMLNYIKKLIRADAGKETTGIFKSLKKELTVLSKDPFEKKAFEDFDFISWVESKIENRSFAEIVREKAKG